MFHSRFDGVVFVVCHAKMSVQVCPRCPFPVGLFFSKRGHGAPPLLFFQLAECLIAAIEPTFFFHVSVQFRIREIPPPPL